MKPPAVELVVRVLLVIVGTITATPVFVLIVPGTLGLGYGIDHNPEPMVLALLQHRGVLQAALGAALIWSAFQPAVRLPVALTAIVTKSSFLALTATVPGTNVFEDVAGAAFDVAAVVFLAAVAVRQTWAGRGATRPAAKDAS